MKEKYDMKAISEKQISLSVCVIGRNEGALLGKCASSFRLLTEAKISYETIYVDSASSDNSLSIANDFFHKVICLEPNANLNAGAARHIGTLNSEGVWILYLDGDMEISQSFLPVLSELINLDKRDEGLCGFTQNIYPDGGRDLIKFKGNIDGYNCSSFGGAVVLPRRAVLDSGNWSCELFSYEEAEFYSRLSLNISAVIWSDKIMVLHRTPHIPLLKKCLGGLFPFHSYLGKKYYGAGQATLYSIRNGSFYSFYKMKPEPYLMFFSIMLALVTLPFFSWYSISFVFASLVINIFRVGIRGALNYAFWTPQIALGLWKLPRAFIPKIRTIKINSDHNLENSEEVFR